MTCASIKQLGLTGSLAHLRIYFSIWFNTSYYITFPWPFPSPGELLLFVFIIETLWALLNSEAPPRLRGTIINLRDQQLLLLPSGCRFHASPMGSQILDLPFSQTHCSTRTLRLVWIFTIIPCTRILSENGISTPSNFLSRDFPKFPFLNSPLEVKSHVPSISLHF